MNKKQQCRGYSRNLINRTKTHNYSFQIHIAGINFCVFNAAKGLLFLREEIFIFSQPEVKKTRVLTVNGKLIFYLSALLKESNLQEI